MQDSWVNPWKPDIFLFLILGVSCIISGSVPSVSADISLTSVVDTVGMVSDHTGMDWQSGVPGVNRTTTSYHDMTMTNGGSFQETKTFSLADKGSSHNFDNQKILQYNSSDGSHLMAEEQLISTKESSASDNSTLCVFMSPSNNSTAQISEIAGAKTSVISATLLNLASRSSVSNGSLTYSISAGAVSGNNSTSQPSKGSIQSSMSYRKTGLMSNTEMNDRLSVTGLITLFNRVYNTQKEKSVMSSSSATGYTSERSELLDQQVATSASSNTSIGMSTVTYNDILLTNGGNMTGTRTLDLDKNLQTEQQLVYTGDGSSAMILSEKVHGTKITNGTDQIGNQYCTFVNSSSGVNQSPMYQQVHASTELIGVESASVSTVSHVVPGDANSTLSLNYQASITSPAGFDMAVAQIMKDTNGDGKYEDLNGNGRADLQDLVLLFKNIEWISKSNYSSRFDYNGNGRFDFADLVYLYNEEKAGK